MKKILTPLVACAALVGASAHAQNAGDWVLGVHWFRLMPQESATPLTLTAPVYSQIPGSSASVSNADTLGLSLGYFITSNVSATIEGGIPPKFKLYGGGTLAQLGQIGEAKQWSPALIGKYHFGDAQSTIRPFVGGGVSYVWFDGIHLTPSLQNGLTNQLHAPYGSLVTSADLRSSFAPVITAGLDWKLSEHWGFAFSVSYLKLKTKATLTTNTITGLPVAVSNTTMKLDPIVTKLGVTYKF